MRIGCQNATTKMIVRAHIPDVKDMENAVNVFPIIENMENFQHVFSKEGEKSYDRSFENLIMIEKIDKYLVFYR